MKKYIAPELEIANFKSEEIMILSEILEDIFDAGESKDGIKFTNKIYE